MASSSSPSLVVFSSDLRIHDNPALFSAAARGKGVVALYIHDETNEQKLGAASRWWLHHSLTSLRDKLGTLNIELVLQSGSRIDQTILIAEKLGLSAIFWNRQYDPAGMAFGRAIKRWAKARSIAATSYNGCLLHDPYYLKTANGSPYRVFTPFWKNFLKTNDTFLCVGAPEKQNNMITIDDKVQLEEWQLLPHAPNWADGFSAHWQPGEEGGQKRLQDFVANRLQHYCALRDFPSAAIPSALSPHLRFGEISPRQIWVAIKGAAEKAGGKNADKFLAELGWREFSHHLLSHAPDLQTANFNNQFDHFPWYDGNDHDARLKAWQKGLTGYPIIDAGMRELWQTGTMHNRVRMIVASFLTKHLLIDWRHGEKWFWQTLLDACPANNSASWQWVAGCGADAAPYFRIFNPVLQSRKFDANGDYLRRFMPELKKLPNAYLHEPWTADRHTLSVAGVTLGAHYPFPMINHEEARKRALSAYELMKQRIKDK